MSTLAPSPTTHMSDAPKQYTWHTSMSDANACLKMSSRSTPTTHTWVLGTCICKHHSHKNSLVMYERPDSAVIAVLTVRFPMVLCGWQCWREVVFSNIGLLLAYLLGMIWLQVALEMRMRWEELSYNVSTAWFCGHSSAHSPFSDGFVLAVMSRWGGMFQSFLYY